MDSFTDRSLPERTSEPDSEREGEGESERREKGEDVFFGQRERERDTETLARGTSKPTARFWERTLRTPATSTSTVVMLFFSFRSPTPRPGGGRTTHNPWPVWRTPTLLPSQPTPRSPCRPLVSASDSSATAGKQPLARVLYRL